MGTETLSALNTERTGVIATKMETDYKQDGRRTANRTVLSLTIQF